MKSRKHQFKRHCYLMRKPEVVSSKLGADVEDVFYDIARFDDADFFRFVLFCVIRGFGEGVENLFDSLAASTIEIYFSYLEISWDDY